MLGILQALTKLHQSSLRERTEERKKKKRTDLIHLLKLASQNFFHYPDASSLETWSAFFRYQIFEEF